MENATKSKILIVEDEVEIRELVSLLLLRQGYTIQAVDSSEAAKKRLETDSFDLIVLDWMLPNESGIDFLDYLKTHLKETLPSILMVTAKAEPDDIVLALDLGADDYITKPFDSRVFLSRIAALLRRRASQSTPLQNRIEYRNLIVDNKTMSARLDGQLVEMTHTEFRLLWALLTHPNVVLTREKILSLIQGNEINVIGRTVDTHLFSLRKKLAPWSDCIVTVRGVGYRFTPSSQADAESQN